MTKAHVNEGNNDTKIFAKLLCIIVGLKVKWMERKTTKPNKNT